MAYRKVKYGKTDLKVYEVTEGEMIETKVERMMNNKEPMSAEGNERMYNTRKDGAHPLTDIRTDRFDQALEMTDNIAAQKLAKRQEALDKLHGKTESADGQNNSSEPVGAETK